MVALRDQFQVGGNRVHVPDLLKRRIFSDRREGRAYVQQIGVDTILERARLAAEKLPRRLVYAGVSMGRSPRTSWREVAKAPWRH